MNGKYIYLAITALLGMLSALVTFFPFLLLTITYLYLLVTYKKGARAQLALYILLFTFCLFVGMMEKHNNKSLIPKFTHHFYVEYTQPQKVDGDLLQVQASEIQYKEDVLIRYKIKTKNEQEFLHRTSFFGLKCKVPGTLAIPKAAKNPNGFNYQNYLAAKKIYWIVEVDDNPLQSCFPTHLTLFSYIKQLRFSGTLYLETHFPNEIASLSAALIFGDRSLFDSDLLGNYQETGIVHLLAISGLHVSLVVGVIFYLGLRAGLTRQFMTNFLLVTLPVYVLITGGSPSVVRAGLMIFLILLADKGRKRVRLLPIDAISIACILLLLFRPMILFDVGFQLSFSVSLAIILSSAFSSRYYPKASIQMFAISIISQLAALPFLLFHYFEMSILGIFANMLYIPLFSFVYLPGIYFLFIVQIIFNKTPQLFLSIFLEIINFFNMLIQILAKFSIGKFTPGRPSVIFLILYIVIIFLIFLLWESKSSKKRNVQLMLLVLLLFTFHSSWNHLTPYGEVTMIDVGQGDSILIQLPFRKGIYLIDTGGTINYAEEDWKKRERPFEVGRDVVVPYLKGKGITKIDKLILTHGDMDHIGGSFSVLSELKIEQILMPAVLEPSETELEIAQLAKKKGIAVLKVSAGNHWRTGMSDFFVLSPEQDFTGDRNSGSIALEVKFGDMNWFFGGDLDQEGEEKIVNKYPDLVIDVLKAGHHGSKTSSAELFLQRIRPKVVLISAGQNNRYGHPHQEVLNRLEAIHSTIYRTDTQGAISYRFYLGETGTFSTYLP